MVRIKALRRMPVFFSEKMVRFKALRRMPGRNVLFYLYVYVYEKIDKKETFDTAVDEF